MTNVADLSFTNNKWVAKFRGQILASSPKKEYVVEGIRSGRCVKANAFNVKDVRELDTTEVVGKNGETKILSAADQFTIDERFQFLSDFTLMVATKVSASLIVSGEGGLGKTFTVNETIQKAGFKDMTEILAETGGGNEALDMTGQKIYTVVKGYSTAKGLYRTLFENRNRITIFDDCDSILRDPVALNLLKGALDSYDKRIISWNAEGFGDDDLPRSFEFKGGIIFISNLPLFKLDGAVKSRALKVDLSMNTDQKLDRMETISKLPSFLPDYSKEAKAAALKFLRKMKDKAPELNMRTLIDVTKCALRDSNWERRAEYLVTAG